MVTNNNNQTNNRVILVQACSWPVRRQSFAKGLSKSSSKIIFSLSFNLMSLVKQLVLKRNKPFLIFSALFNHQKENENESHLCLSKIKIFPGLLIFFVYWKYTYLKVKQDFIDLLAFVNLLSCGLGHSCNEDISPRCKTQNNSPFSNPGIWEHSPQKIT